MKKKIKLTKSERRSGFNRLMWAECLILQLPEDHEGRNSWLLNYGIRCAARKLREQHPLEMTWSAKHRAANPAPSL